MKSRRGHVSNTSQSRRHDPGQATSLQDDVQYRLTSRGVSGRTGDDGSMTYLENIPRDRGLEIDREARGVEHFPPQTRKVFPTITTQPRQKLECRQWIAIPRDPKPEVSDISSARKPIHDHIDVERGSSVKHSKSRLSPNTTGSTESWLDRPSVHFRQRPLHTLRCVPRSHKTISSFDQLLSISSIPYYCLPLTTSGRTRLLPPRPDSYMASTLIDHFQFLACSDPNGSDLCQTFEQKGRNELRNMKHFRRSMTAGNIKFLPVKSDHEQHVRLKSRIKHFSHLH